MAGFSKKRTKTPFKMRPLKQPHIDGMVAVSNDWDDPDNCTLQLYSDPISNERYTGTGIWEVSGHETNTGTALWHVNGHEPDDLFIGREESYEWVEHDADSSDFCIVSTLDPDTARLNAIGILRFTVKIENITAFTSRTRSVKSDQFKCRGLPFQLIINNKGRGLALSAFVCRAETENPVYDSGLEMTAQCELSVYDQIDETYKVKRSYTYTFRAGGDWGFTPYLTKHQAALLSPGIFHQNSLIIHVHMKAEPPHCHGSFSKAVTGFVGIRNQGATCYMNSLLQVLYFLTKFRTACYRIPTEMDDSSSMALALQKVFYNLEFSDSPVCTKNLTKSFGWSSVDVLMQHDVQEMMRILIDKIESRMKSTLLEPILPSIFQGKFVSYVKCRDIEFSSQREEVFYDIQLSLDNSNNVYDSFKRYVSPEMMDDDNKYHAGTHGLQAAEKGTLFMSLPPVMFLHLLRFQFDATLSQVAKNNNYFEFYDRINLTEFVREDESTVWNYTLFAVLSHSGGGTHGHYVAYINPSLKGKWFKFDDDTISIVSACDAIDANFGSKSDVDEWAKSTQLNAYMLVYVRDSMADEVFKPTDPKYICEELKNVALNGPIGQSFHKGFGTVEVFVLLETFLESDLTLHIDRYVNVPRFSMSKNMTTDDFKKELISAFRLSGSFDQIRMWRIVRTQFGYTYPMYLNDEVTFMYDVLRDGSSAPPTVWLEMALPGEVLPPFDQEEDVLVFYNCYCAEKCCPMYIHHGYHNKNSSIAELIPKFNQLMEWTNRELNLYGIHRDTKVEELDTAKRFSDYLPPKSMHTMHMQIVFEPKKHEVSTKLNRIPLYYQDLLCRVEFRVGNADNSAKNEEHFRMSLELTFPDLLDELARRLNYDRMKIQIFRRNWHASHEPVASTSTDTLRSLFDCDINKVVQLLYKLHTVDVIDVETKHNVTFQWLSVDMKKHGHFTLYLSDNETVESILATAKKHIEPDRAHGSGKFRLLKVCEDQLSIIDDVSEIYSFIESLQDRHVLQKFPLFRIEEIPKEDEILHENERFIAVFHTRFHIQSKPATYPFMFKIDVNETWHCIKDRLRCHLNIPEKNWTEDCAPTVSLSNEWDDLGMDDAKCFNDIIVQQPLETLFICLNRAKNSIKQRRCSNKIDLARSVC